MIGRVRDDWRRFKASKPGHRFRDRYRRHRRGGQGRFALRKVLYIVSGSVISIASLLLAPLPGPGWGTFLVGLVMLAGELLVVARFLDWAEMKLGGQARRAKVVWASLPATVRILLIMLGSICGAILGLWALFSGFRWLV